MSFPTLAIAVVSYNSAKWLDKCLSTLLDNVQNYPAKVEIGLIENGEPAQSAKLAKSFEWQNLKFFAAPQNLGYGGAANYGWENLVGEICLVLNPDMSFPANWLLRLIEPFRHDPQIGVIGCKLLYEDKRIQHAGGIVKYGAALVETFGQGQIDDGRFDESYEAEFVTGAALAVRREIVEKLGGFDSSFFPGYFEDVDLCYRVRQLGYKIWYEGTATAFHYEGAAFGRGKSYYRAFHRNRLRFALKHFSTRQLLEEFLPAERARLMNTTEKADRLAALAVFQATRAWFLQGEEKDMSLLDETDSAQERLIEHIAEVKQNWLVEEKPFRSRLPFVAIFRERINSLSTKWYVKPILAQQVEYNAAVSRAIEDLGNIVAGKIAADDLEASTLASRLILVEERLIRIEILLEKLAEKQK